MKNFSKLSAWWLYLLFVIYGSFVPFELRSYSLEAAWNLFLHIRYLKLGVESRADWIANLVLYVPLGALTAAMWIRSTRSASIKFIIGLASFVLCASVAIAVEFCQIFFAPRTVSLNDIIAELIGSAAGIFIWVFFGRWLEGLADEVKLSGRRAISAALTIYLLGYLAISFFPYDFLVSWAEIQQKQQLGRDHLLLASASCRSLFFCLSKLGAEVMSTVPIGVLFVINRRKQDRPKTSPLMMGLVLGIVVEGVQFFLASGSGEGISVLTRASGVVLGTAMTGSEWRRRIYYVVQPYLPAGLILGIVPYLAFVAKIAWAHKGPWLSIDRGLDRLADLHFLPFYYHYYTTETVALVSLVIEGVMYAPIGVALWIWVMNVPSRLFYHGAFFSGFYAAIIAFAIEFVKLFLAQARPDPTDILIGAVAAAVAFRVTDWLASAISFSARSP